LLGRPVGRFPTDLVLGLAIAAVAFVACLPFLNASFQTLRRDAGVTADEGTLVSDADRMARGHAPYREVFAFRGPYAYLPYVAAFKVAEPSARNARLVQFVIIALLSAIVYALGLAVTHRRLLAVVLASWPFLVAWPAWPFAYFDLGTQLYCALAGLAVVIVEAQPGHRWDRLIVVAGAFGGAALWSSFAQGVPVMIALSIALALKDRSVGARSRDLWLRQARFWGGALVSTLAMVVWLLPYHAVVDAMRDVVFFPLRYYRSEANKTHYAYDIEDYVPQWTAIDRRLGWAVRACFYGMAALPALAVLIALAWIALSVLFPRRGWGVAALPRGALAASAIAAPAVPVLVSRTRSDVCHIGFVAVGCTVVIAALVSSYWRARSPWRRFAGLLAFLALLVPPAGSLIIYGYGLRVRPRVGTPIDEQGRASCPADLYAARLRPDDRFVSTPYGGWSYTYSRRDNATSFALLYEDPYCEGQWPTAARQIVERKPAFLAMSATLFDLLAAQEPALKTLYFGYDGNYLLDRAEPGPALASTKWSLIRRDRQGREIDRRDLELTVEGQLPRVLGTFRGSGVLRAALYGDRFTLFDESVTYIGILAADGARIEGRVFTGWSETGTFRAVSAGTRGAAR
jgi:hypothetical protein